MATPSKFVGDFRAQVTAMLDTINAVQALCAQHTAMGWTATDFDTAASSELTSPQFQAAVDTCKGFASNFLFLQQQLARLRA